MRATQEQSEKEAAQRDRKRRRDNLDQLFHRTEERSSKLRQTSTHRLLSQIDDELDDLLGVALQAPIGAPSLDLSTPQDLQAIQFQEAVAEAERLQREIDEVEKQLLLRSLNEKTLDIAEIPSGFLPDFIKELEEKLRDLKQKVLEKSSQNIQLQLFIDRVAEAEVVNKIYEQGTHSDMRLQFEQQVHEVTEIADLKKLLTEMQSRRHFLREQIDRYRVANRELFASLKEYQSPTIASISRRDPEVAELQAQVDILVGENRILNIVLQNMIIASGVNWAADEELSELMLSLGDPL